MSDRPARRDRDEQDPLAIQVKRRRAPEYRPPPGQESIILLGLSIGILMMGIQLWLLTLAYDLYQLDEDRDLLLVAILSGLIFLGGLAILRFLDQRPRR